MVKLGDDVDTPTTTVRSHTPGVGNQGSYGVVRHDGYDAKRGGKPIFGEQVETTARGAAALAGLGVGAWSDPAEAGALRSEPRRFEGTLAEGERSERLEQWRAAVTRVLTKA